MSEDSLDRIVERMLDGDELSRRTFVRHLAGAGLAVTGASTLLAACGGVEGTKDKAGEGPNTDVTHAKVAIDQLNFANWPLYIDEESIGLFEKETGGKVKYTEEINDNEEFFGKVRAQLERDQTIKRDIVVLTDWMAARWIRLNYVTPIDKANVPNMGNLQAGLTSPEFDKERNFTLPWQSGITAIGYNPQKTGRKLTSVNDLFDPKFKGRVSFLSEARDSVSLVMLASGIKPEDASIDDVLAAVEKLDEENRKGQIRRFTGNDYTTDLTKGNLWAALAYSGDVIQLQADNPELEFLVPDEGAVLWSDNMMIPDKAEHPYAAEVLMNYVYDPVVAARIAAYVNYVTPVKGAQEELAKDDPETAENELIFPTEATLAKLHPYPSLTDDEDRQMNEAMQAVVGA